jgi:hypothetical protein
MNIVNETIAQLHFHQDKNKKLCVIHSQLWLQNVTKISCLLNGENQTDAVSESYRIKLYYSDHSN